MAAAGALFRRIEKGDVAEQRQIVFVFDGVVAFGCDNLLVSDCDDAEAVLVQSPHLRLGLGEVSCIQVAKLAIELIMRAD